jgi:uncharacterized protein YbcI
MEASERSPERSERGAQLAQLSRELVQIHARLYGRGPTKARSHIHSTYALVVLEEILTQAEKTLIDSGSWEHVRDTRMKFQDAVQDEFIGAVERIVGKPVRSFFSQIDVTSDTSIELFIFEDDREPGEGEPDDRG